MYVKVKIVSGADEYILFIHGIKTKFVKMIFVC